MKWGILGLPSAVISSALLSPLRDLKHAEGLLEISERGVRRGGSSFQTPPHSGPC